MLKVTNKETKNKERQRIFIEEQQLLRHRSGRSQMFTNCVA